MNALLRLMLRGSAIGALALVATAVGCSSDDTDDNPGAAGESDGGRSGGGSSNGGTKSDAGEPGMAGEGPTPNGGSGGSSGSAQAGAGGDNVGGETSFAGAPAIGPGAEGGSPAFGAGGETSTGTGPSVAKFCNTVSFGGDDVTLILEVGAGSEKVTFTATSGECVPADGQECKEIPQGPDVPIALFDADAPTASLDEKVADVGAGEDWVFWTDLETVDDDTNPVITGTTINQKVARCDEIVYADIP